MMNWLTGASVATLVLPVAASLEAKRGGQQAKPNIAFILGDEIGM
jgi:hypothetical protein